MPASAPIIETERLRLRPHRMEDFAASCAMWGDPEVARFIGGKPSTQEEVWSRLLRYHGLWPALGFGYWAIEERATGAFIGDIGFADFHRAIDPPLADRPEHGWALMPSAQGRGLAGEALSATLKWAEGHFRVGETVAIIAPENAPSIRLAERHGYGDTATATYREASTLMLRRPLNRTP